jgi:hypothetical protein
MGLAALTVAAVAPLPASAITCGPGTHLGVIKTPTGSRPGCVAGAMAKKGGGTMKKAPTPKPMPKHT